MNLPREGARLRIFVGESDQWQGQPLYHAIVEEARRRGLAGASVFRGIEGFGGHSRIHTTRILRLSEDLPVLVEIVDSEERIQAFLPTLEGMVDEGLVTLEEVSIVVYRSGKRPPG